MPAPRGGRARDDGGTELADLHGAPQHKALMQETYTERLGHWRRAAAGVGRLGLLAAVTIAMLATAAAPVRVAAADARLLSGFNFISYTGPTLPVTAALNDALPAVQGP